MRETDTELHAGSRRPGTHAVPASAVTEASRAPLGGDAEPPQAGLGAAQVEVPLGLEVRRRRGFQDWGPQGEISCRVNVTKCVEGTACWPWGGAEAGGRGERRQQVTRGGSAPPTPPFLHGASLLRPLNHSIPRPLSGDCKAAVGGELKALGRQRAAREHGPP